MKRKSIALLGIAAFAGVALAGCAGGSGNNSGTGTTSTSTVDPNIVEDEALTKVADKYYTGAGNEAGKAVWSPKTYAEVSSAYNVDSTKDINLWIVYNKKYGCVYNEKNPFTNPVDGLTYTKGSNNVLPSWKTFATNLGIKGIVQAGKLDGTSDDKAVYDLFTAAYKDGKYQDEAGNTVDLFYNTTSNLNELGDSNRLVDLSTKLDKMPAFKKFLDDNPSVKEEVTHNGKIFYTPYMDGFQAIERHFVMDTTHVETLLDEEIGTGLGQLVAGAAAPADSKGLKGAPKAQAFIGSDGENNYDKDMEISIVNPKDNTKKNVTVKKTTNILKLQNQLLATTDGSCTGKALIEQFKTYARAAYGDIIDTYYDGKISKMFTSVGACYNADDLVALLRIFKANPDVLYDSATAYVEVVPVFPRGQADNRVENILNFGATLYGVQGRGSEYDHLFFGADGMIHDFDTATASFDMLDKLHDLYQEGLIQANFWAGSGGSDGLNKFFAHKFKQSETANSTFGLLEYDYLATQSFGNDMSNALGTKTSDRQTVKVGDQTIDFKNIPTQGIKGILSPLTYVATEEYNWLRKLDSNKGKTLTRYYEENRAVKNTSWAIPTSSDNIDSALALMDYMFTKEGWEIQNFGPSDYWEYGKIFGDDVPVLKESTLKMVSDNNLDFWSFFRGYMGATQGIGHYRPAHLDYQATNDYAKQSYTDLVKACDLGVQMTSRSVPVTNANWHSSMVMSNFSTLDVNISNQYIGVTDFWKQKGKADKNGAMNGWVAIVVEGKDSTTKFEANGKQYDLAAVKYERVTKNQTYLQRMGYTYQKEAPEALKA